LTIAISEPRPTDLRKLGKKVFRLRRETILRAAAPSGA
jgi:hypothetical protein